MLVSRKPGEIVAGKIDSGLARADQFRLWSIRSCNNGNSVKIRLLLGVKWLVKGLGSPFVYQFVYFLLC